MILHTRRLSAMERGLIVTGLTELARKAGEKRHELDLLAVLETGPEEARARLLDAARRAVDLEASCNLLATLAQRDWLRLEGGLIIPERAHA